MINFYLIFLFLIICCLCYYACPSFSPFARLHPVPHHSLRQSSHHCPCLWAMHMCSFCFIFLKISFIISRDKRREGDRERNINVWLLLARPQLGTWPAIHAYALTGNWTCDPLVHRLALNPLSHTSQGYMFFLKLI